MVDTERARIATLARRVGWLDRYRRSVAIAVALAFVAGLTFELDLEIRARTLAAVAFPAILLWWFVEVALAWLTAVWETELARLLRDRGLPRAEIVRRR